MLPKQNAIRYEITIPSTGKTVKFRPFTVREEKALLLAKESEELGAILATLKTVIEACIEPKIDVEKLASFDLQYIMIHLRTKSVGEHVRLQFECGECESKDPILFSLDMTKIVVSRTEGHTNKIDLFADVGVVMKYPSIQQVEQLTEIEKDPIKVIELFADLVDYIYDSEELHHGSEQKREDLIDFFQDLTSEQFKKVAEFIKTMPKIEHTIEYACPACNAKHKRSVKGFKSFFF